MFIYGQRALCEVYRRFLLRGSARFKVEIQLWRAFNRDPAGFGCGKRRRVNVWEKILNIN